MIVGFVGGTGPAGTGIAARFARAGIEVLLGSRSADRAQEAASAVRALVPNAVAGAGLNEDVAARSDVVFLTMRYDAQRPAVEALGARLADRIVVSINNPLQVVSGEVVQVDTGGASMAEEVAALVPGARVVGAFHEINVRRYAKVDRPIDSDTLVCADDDEAKKVVMDLARSIEGLRPLDGGALENCRYVERFVGVLIGVNFRYRASASLRITGLPDA